MNKLLLIIIIFMICFAVVYLYMHWFIVFALALLNSSAKYNETDRKNILRLAEKEKLWKDVSKVLDLKEDENK